MIKQYINFIPIRWRHYLAIHLPKNLMAAYYKRQKKLKPRQLPNYLQEQLVNNSPKKVNLCCGPVILKDFINVDIDSGADLVIDLEKELLPFKDNSVEVLICISAINYFTRGRAQKIIKDIYRVLRPGGIVRFAVQDLKLLAKKYLNQDKDFFNQKLANGQPRFIGETLADKFNNFFYGFRTLEGKHGQYMYDFESLKLLFCQAGFNQIYQKNYLESKIPDIQKIDNRPEQTFFLEAYKDDNIYYYGKGNQLWRRGQKEKAWQRFLYSLDLKIKNKNLVYKILNFLNQKRRWIDAIVLLKTYLKEVQNDNKAKLMLAKYENKLKSQEKSQLKQVEHQKKHLAQFSARNNLTKDNHFHLKAAMSWLKKAHSSSQDKGMPAMYDGLQKEWLLSYPETSGYIIPTCLVYGQLIHDKFFINLTEVLARWEVKLQLPNGGLGEPVGIYLPRPRVFNTAQAILGWLAIDNTQRTTEYLNPIIKGADFIVRHLHQDGYWDEYNSYNGPKVYDSRITWILFEVAKLTQREIYEKAARLSLRWVLKQAKPNGWFYYNNFSQSFPHRKQKKPALTHLIGYNYVALLKIYQLNKSCLNNKLILSLLIEAANNIINFYTQKDSQNKYLGLPATFDRHWQSKDNYSCLTGNLQIAFFLKSLGKETGKKVFILIADKLIDDVKKLQLINNRVESPLWGGLFGSDPIEGNYCPYQIPNWGVKFFADVLMQKYLSLSQQRFLG